MYSITLQTNDNIITSGERLGQIQFAAPSESDGSAAIDIAGSVFCQAEGSFQSASNPTSIVLATAAADASAAVGRIKITDNGHIMPMADASYDLGNSNLQFRTSNFSEGVILASNTPSDTTNKLYNEGGTLKFNGSEVGGAGGTPGGADTNVQYNDAGSFGGESDFTYNATTNTLTVPTGAFGAVTFTNLDANVYVGNSVSQTSQDYNILIGQSAGSTNLFTGNIGMGYRSLNANASSFTTYNTCIGYQTMYSSQGGRNVAIGYEAMYDVGTNNLIQKNIGIGQRALARIDGDNNIEIATAYGASENTGMGTTVSNRLNIGHTIFGNISDKKIRIGMSGINTSYDTAPDATLEVLPEANTDLVLLAKGTNGQSANLQEWRNASDTTLLAVGFDGGLELPDNVPGTTTNKLYNNAGTLTFNGSAVGGGTTYSAGSGITIDANDEIHFGDSNIFLTDNRRHLSFSTQAAPVATTGGDVTIGSYHKGFAIFSQNDGGVVALFTDDDIGNDYVVLNPEEIRLFSTTYLKPANYFLTTPLGGLAVYDSDGTTLGEIKCDFANIDINSSSATGLEITAAASQSADIVNIEDSSSNALFTISGGGALTLAKGVRTNLLSSSSASNKDFDLSTSPSFRHTLGAASVTLSVSNGGAGNKFTIALTQDGTGSRTVTWWSNILWPGGLEPTLTTTAGKTDVFGFIEYSTGNYYGFVIGYNL